MREVVLLDLCNKPMADESVLRARTISILRTPFISNQRIGKTHVRRDRDTVCNESQERETIMNRVGVVTVLYNSVEVLPGFFRSLSKQVNVALTVYVIDNSATHEGCELSEKLGAEHGISVITLFNAANLGVATGNNQGIRMALNDGVDFVALSNNDVEFDDPSMFEGMIHEMAKAGVVASVPKMLYFATRTIWCAGGSISRVKAISPHLGDMEQDVGQFDKPGITEYAPTCFMILTPDVFRTVGFMDEQYFVYYDDTDFVWRLNQHGLSILYTPQYELFHKVSFSTGGNDSLFSLYYATRNRLFFARKNLPIAYRLISIIYTVAAMSVKCLRFSPDRRKKVMQALRDGLKTKLA